ncbi:uncharacterized protein LOC131496726 isoform X4 [Neofelis nebulosa]|uniref:uncharacterized protein LOC131496726 isoform X4 n=1 Tax=Neofelis nebulosa TaxID=61452 RepID=UPI00272D8AF7|nr:uncharacterized protein LOC131496726 isoform X4 [Neofelis nebulosa]
MREESSCMHLLLSGCSSHRQVVLEPCCLGESHIPASSFSALLRGISGPHKVSAHPGVPALWKRSVPMNTFENQSGGKWTQLADRCTKSMETNHRYSETQFKALEAGCGDVELLRADDSRRLLESGTWLGNVVLRMCFYRLAECEGRSVITPDNTGSLLLGTTVPS